MTLDDVAAGAADEDGPVPSSAVSGGGRARARIELAAGLPSKISPMTATDTTNGTYCLHESYSTVEVGASVCRQIGYGAPGDRVRAGRMSWRAGDWKPKVNPSD